MCILIEWQKLNCSTDMNDDCDDDDDADNSVDQCDKMSMLF